MKILVESQRKNIEHGPNSICTVPYSYDACGMVYLCPPYTDGPCEGGKMGPWYITKEDK